MTSISCLAISFRIQWGSPQRIPRSRCALDIDDFVDLFGLPAGNHQVRLALVDQNTQELPGASTISNFNVQQPPTGELQLQPVLSGLNFPVGLSLAPDGRIFYSERLTGAIRVINPSWVLDPTPFCPIPISVSTSGEQGLLGLTLDPSFSSSNEAGARV